MVFCMHARYIYLLSYIFGLENTSHKAASQHSKYLTYLPNNYYINNSVSINLLIESQPIFAKQHLRIYRYPKRVA